MLLAFFYLLKIKLLKFYRHLTNILFTSFHFIIFNFQNIWLNFDIIRKKKKKLCKRNKKQKTKNKKTMF